MGTSFSWTCPYCGRHATITDSNYSEDKHYFNNNNKDGQSVIITAVVTCPNNECREYEIRGTLYPVYKNGTTAFNSKRLEWNMKPQSLAKQLPTYIPQAICEDYDEACLIKTLSPKASATLSRRCLQGIIRDFFKIKNKKTLHDEITAIQEKIDPLTWKAIDAVRKIGNIGAHMEKDINLIIDVEPEEAQLLIALIETLINDWYIARHEKEKTLESITNVAKAKTAERESNKPTQSSTETPTH